MDVGMFFILIAVAVFAATYGSLVGAGGGFIMVPVLLFLFPHESPSLITATSLGGVFVNGLSGSWVYHRQGRIDYRTGIYFAISRIPGAILGAIIVEQLALDQFKPAFGALLLLVGLYILLRPKSRPTASGKEGSYYRRIVDRLGTTWEYSFNLPIGMTASFLVGVISALFGIGGGLIMTPVMVAGLGMPAQIAAATSVFNLPFTSISAIGTHLVTGGIGGSLLQILAVGIGMLFGAQIGPRIARRLTGVVIVRTLAVALSAVGLELVITSFI